MPHSSLDSFYFLSSGSEAVQAALKMVRGITRKQNIITMQGAYYGRTSHHGSSPRSKNCNSLHLRCTPLSHLRDSRSVRREVVEVALPHSRQDSAHVIWRAYGRSSLLPFPSQRIISPQAMTLDAIANIPRSAFSRQQIQMMFWFLKRVIRPSAYLSRTEWHNLAPSSPTLDRQPSMELEPLMVQDPGVRHEDYPAGWYARLLCPAFNSLAAPPAPLPGPPSPALLSLRIN